MCRDGKGSDLERLFKDLGPYSFSKVGSGSSPYMIGLKFWDPVLGIADPIYPSPKRIWKFYTLTYVDLRWWGWWLFGPRSGLLVVAIKKPTRWSEGSEETERE